jgi:hypothetical protein
MPIQQVLVELVKALLGMLSMPKTKTCLISLTRMTEVEALQKARKMEAEVFGILF